MGPIPVRLTSELQERIDTLAEQLSMTRSGVIRLAIRQWLDASERRQLNPIILQEDAGTYGTDGKTPETTPPSASQPEIRYAMPKKAGRKKKDS